MSGGFPLGLDVCNGHSLTAGVGALAIVAVAGASSANTKGSWTQLISSTSADCCFALIQMVLVGQSSLRTFVVDLAVGASGSENIVVNDLMIPSQGNGGTPYGASYLLPLSIPAGTRVAARCQSSVASSTVYLGVTTFDGASTQIEGYAGVDALGFVSTTTLGTATTPSATVNTKGSYAQLIASTTRDYAGLMFAFDGQNSSGNLADYDIDIAIGVSGSEKVIIPDLSMGVYVSYGFYNANVGFIPISIPAGTRIAARCAMDAASGVAIGVTAYGVYQ